MPDHTRRDPRSDDTVACPGCRQPMRLVGKERDASAPESALLTFQCGCGQVFAITTNH